MDCGSAVDQESTSPSTELADDIGDPAGNDGTFQARREFPPNSLPAGGCPTLEPFDL